MKTMIGSASVLIWAAKTVLEEAGRRTIFMKNEVKEKIGRYIEFLSGISHDNIEFKEWVPNCIKCLQFALDK